MTINGENAAFVSWFVRFIHVSLSIVLSIGFLVLGFEFWVGTAA